MTSADIAETETAKIVLIFPSGLLIRCIVFTAYVLF